MISKGQQSTNEVARTLYMGVGAVKVLAVNPNKATLEKIYGRTMDKDPVYLGEVDVNGEKVKNVRISFVIQTDAAKNNGIEFTSNHTFFLQKKYRQGSKSGKYQIIDKYGRTGWATKEEIQAKTVPVYANGPANIDADYRPCYVGEEELTAFVKNYLNIPNLQSYVNNMWVPNPKVKPEDCESRLDHIEDYFKGNFKELVELIAFQPENIVKIAFGVRTTDDNKQYQTTYTQMSLKSGVSDYSKLDADIQERKAAGAFATTEFEAGLLHEYSVTPTTFTADTANTTDQKEEESPW